jgi:hypothetical protein
LVQVCVVDFWAVIGSSNGSGSDEIKRALTRISERLAELESSELENFIRQLREALYRLDQRNLAEVPVRLASGMRADQSDDHFLYARCACVLAGEKAFRAAAVSEDEFANYVGIDAQSAEELLYLAPDRYEELTGRRPMVAGLRRIDSGSNKAEW